MCNQRFQIRVWRYNRDNQNPYIKEEQGHKKKYKRSNNDLQNIHIKLEEFEDTKGIIRIRNSKQTTQWPKEKEQKDKQWPTKFYT
jgi:hypothetical protein